MIITEEYLVFLTRKCSYGQDIIGYTDYIHVVFKYLAGEFSQKQNITDYTSYIHGKL